MSHDADRIACIGQRRVQRIMVSHGRDAAQEILQAPVQQATVTRDIDHRPERVVGAHARLDIGNPFPNIPVLTLILDVREAVELQMVVGIDQPGEQSIARQINDQVRGARIATHGRDSRSNHTHGRRSVIDGRRTDRRIDERECA